MRHAAHALGFALVASFLLQAQRDHGPPPSPLAQKCGSQIAWQPNLEAALARAKELKRPIFWYLATIPRSPMDRKPVVDMYMRAGPFSMPDVVSAINRRFVAVKAYPTRDEAKARKLAPLEFIEPGFLILSPDGTEIGRIDRLSTFHELWFVTVLNMLVDGSGELSRPSDEATKATNPLDEAEGLLLDGLWEIAAAPLSKAPADADKVRLAYLRARIAARLGDAKTAGALLEGVSTPEAQVEAGLLALRNEDWKRAEEILAKVSGGARHDEARYLLGVARHRLNRQPEAYEGWKALSASAPDSPWAAKAAAEVERYGPFGRGFEEYGYLPSDAIPAAASGIAGTQRARTPKEADWLVRRSVRYLLERQNPDGGFDDSNYDFGGRDSLPDVYVAVTALSALALLEWAAIEPERIKAAVSRGFSYLADESHVATNNRQERVWAHSYRALFFSRLIAAGGPLAEPAAAKLKEVSRLLTDLQAEDGGFAHEYPNPFATATALHALKVADKAGAPGRASTFDRGATALKGSRGDDGTYSYGFSRQRGSKNVDMAGGRMPTCELALFLCGGSSEEKLAAAIKTSFEHHAALEQVRKYDDHAPPHGIGGFFFWYDVFGRCLAIDALGDPDKKRSLFERERKLIAEISEIDGRFVDSHELGKPYGTAMALLSLKLAAPGGP
jgi:hypothetical protein